MFYGYWVAEYPSRAPGRSTGCCPCAPGRGDCRSGSAANCHIVVSCLTILGDGRVCGLMDRTPPVDQCSLVRCDSSGFWLQLKLHQLVDLPQRTPPWRMTFPGVSVWQGLEVGSQVDGRAAPAVSDVFTIPREGAAAAHVNADGLRCFGDHGAISVGAGGLQRSEVFLSALSIRVLRSFTTARAIRASRLSRPRQRSHGQPRSWAVTARPA